MSFVLEAATEPVSPSLPLWVTVVLAIATVLFGTGGIAAVLKVYADRRQGVQSHEMAEDDAIVARWKQLSESQIEMLLEPVQKRLTNVEKELEGVKRELGESRRKYWAAVGHIRQLYVWINRHMPEAITTDPPLPAPPANLAEDI